MKGFLWVIMLVSVVGGTSAQVPSSGSELRENIHLHLNKTTFFQGESIWFTAYVQDQNAKTLSKTTRNLHVALSDSEGKTVAKKTIYVENGIGIGDFELDTTFTDTDYALTAWTNYMRNFTALKPFRQPIIIVRETGKQTMETDLGPVELLAWPEGGRLIAGAYNQLAFRLSDGNGTGISQEVMLLRDRSGAVVRSGIATDADGYGRIGFMVDATNGEYALEFPQKDKESVKRVLSLPTQEDIGIQVDNSLEGKVVVKLLGSKELITAKSNEHYTLAIFQDENLFIQDVFLDENEPVIALKRELIPYGVNTLVLMGEELKPIAYRMFFNHIAEQSRMISTLTMTHNLELDTLRLEVTLPAALEGASLSISALPSATLSYRPLHSIATSFLLQPYLSEHRGIPHEYLKEDSVDRKNRFQLDTQLLLDGYGNYSWDSRVVQEVQLDYAREAGFEISGKIQDADLAKEKQVYLVTDQTKDMAYEDLQNDKTFSANMNLYQGDSLAITLLGAKGKLRKAKAGVVVKESDNDVSSPYFDYTTTLVRGAQRAIQDMNVTDPIRLKGNTIILDEATVNAKLKKTKKVLLSAVTEANFIHEDDLKRTPSLLAYLLKFGIKPTYRNGEMILEKITASFPPPPPFFVTINGMMATDTELITMPLSMVDIVVVTEDKKLGYAINIQLKSDYISPEKRNKYVRFLIENGYGRSRPYTEPAYADYESDYFGYYGVLDWQPNVRINSSEPTQINIPVHGQESIQLHIEGIALDGSLIHLSKKIKVRDTP